MEQIVIRENIEVYMKELRSWVKEIVNTPPEEMSSFFARRIEGYEQHMEIWKDAYRRLGEMIPHNVRDILDLGCGMGLEIEEIYKRFPDVYITGIDMSREMLDRLEEKFKNKNLELFCVDYFRKILPEESFDVVVAVETLHHFPWERKRGLYEKLYKTLRRGGMFIEVDYIACCEEEEELLRDTMEIIRTKWHPDSEYIHFDIALTANREMGIMRMAGFEETELVDSIHGATFIVARKI